MHWIASLIYAKTPQKRDHQPWQKTNVETCRFVIFAQNSCNSVIWASSHVGNFINLFNFCLGTKVPSTSPSTTCPLPPVGTPSFFHLQLQVHCAFCVPVPLHFYACVGSSQILHSVYTHRWLSDQSKIFHFKGQVWPPLPVGHSVFRVPWLVPLSQEAVCPWVTVKINPSF